MLSQSQVIQLKTNYHEVSLQTAKPIYEYQLEIENSTPEMIQSALRQFRPQILEMLVNFMSIDNKIYSPKIAEGIEKGRPKTLGALQNNQEAQPIVSIQIIGRLNENHINKAQIWVLFKQLLI